MAAPKGNRYAAKYDDGEMEIIIEDLLDYAQNDKSIHFAPWCRKHKVSKAWLQNTSEHYPKLKEAIDEANELMSAKIVNSSFQNQGNAHVGMKYLPIYDKQYKELLKWKADIQKEAINKEENKCTFNEWKEQQKEK